MMEEGEMGRGQAEEEEEKDDEVKKLNDATCIDPKIHSDQ